MEPLSLLIGSLSAAFTAGWIAGLTAAYFRDRRDIRRYRIIRRMNG
jgi:hypothetical protein